MHRRQWITALLLFLAIAVAAFFLVRSRMWQVTAPGGDPEAGNASSGVGNENDWYSVYFSQPQAEESSSFNGGPDAALAEALRGARLSVDMAVYELDLWSLRDALKAVHRNGVVVRVVTDSDNLGGPDFQSLVEVGIPVVGDGRENLMHNKFIIIDRLEVWTGSMNMTIGSAYQSENNLMRIRSPELAENYLVEFEEMFSEGKFGDNSPENTPHPAISIAGTRLETYFSPEDGIANRLVELIHEAQESVYFLAYSFTSDDIASALLERDRVGITVAGVMDESQALNNASSEYDRLREAGLDVFLDGNPGRMHHKVLIIDEKVVVTGSYNLSANAELRNDENTLILYNSEIAELYLAEFNRILGGSQR